MLCRTSSLAQKLGTLDAGFANHFQPYLIPPHSTKESVFTVGNDRMLKELEVPDLQVVKELNAGVTLGQIALSNSEQMMFAGTSEGGKPGCVRAYSFPLTGDYLEVRTCNQQRAEYGCRRTFACIEVNKSNALKAF